MSTQNFKKDPVWIPDEKCGERLKALMQSIEKNFNLKFDDYWAFHKWTVENIEEFWAEIWDFSGVIYSKTYDNVVDLTIPMEESPKWFEGATLNIAENLLKFRDDRTALILAGEDRKVERITFKQLYEETKIYAAALRKMGLHIGDRVACYMSNREEAVIAMLAVTSIGAIWTGGRPTLEPSVYLNRVKQVQPKFLFAVDQFSHNQQNFYLLKNINEIVEGLPSLEKVIIVPAKPESKLKSISYIRNSCFLDEFKRLAYESDGSLADMVFEQVSFSHPAYINYTSGSTGLPKTIVHGFGGLLAIFRDHGIHWNNQSSDVWLSMSPVGWVSWNYIINLLFIGSSIVLFEGVPYFLSPTYLWDLIDELKITRLFLTPRVLDELEDRKYLPTEKHNLNSLNLILAGSSVVKPRNYIFALNKLKQGLHCVNGCGSTETMGCHLASDQTLPMYLEEISSPCLGVAVECLNEKGWSCDTDNAYNDHLRNHVLGEMGEFAITKPLPHLPLYLWEDTNGEKFKKAYFSMFPGKFTLGDSIIINPITKGIIVCGRSDETLKQRGTRFGSAEIYNVVKLFPEIKDCLCVGQYSKEKDERAVLFIQMKEGFSLNEDLTEKLSQRIAKELTGSHIPEVILEAPRIPYNANGKKTEIIIKKIINKLPHDPESVVNSDCLQFYYNIPELNDF